MTGNKQSNPLSHAIQWISLAFLISVPINLAHADIEIERQILELPEPSASHIPAQTNRENHGLTRQEFTIGRNQTLSHALDSINQTPQIVHQITQSENAQYFTQLQVGDTLVLWTDQDNLLQKMDLTKSRELSYHLTRDQNQFQIQAHQKPIEIKIQMASATIHDSFYLAGDAAGLSARTIMNLADIFAWDVDFVRELRQGDELKVIYERRYLKEEYIGDGKILAAELKVGGKRSVKAVRFEKDGEFIGYFDENGHNLRKAFMRNPINYTRISSRFQRNRLHPVLNVPRDHKGVDYAAPTGTPIYAAGDGVISFRGWRGGYGNKIKIQHAGRYETVYGHMSRFGRFRNGQSVKQGDVIGYVGMTGLATGPHLHYEFRINGTHHDPLTVKFPDAEPVRADLRNEFIQYASIMESQLTRIDPETTQLAMNFE